MNRKSVILITGPTASGKTTLAIDLARQLQTEIISADSRQCYRELNIGVAKPSPAQLSSVKHFFVDSYSIREPVNAATFEDYALKAAEEIFSTHDTAVMVGGTGLYIKAFCEGLDRIPPINETIRMDIIKGYESFGIGWLQHQLERMDPLYFKEGEMRNPQRMMRALEVKRATGISIREFQQKNHAPRNFDIFKVGISLPKESLYENINARVEDMLTAGLLNEVTSLLPEQHLNALQTVGYSELFDYLNGFSSLSASIESIKRNTRQYAKRQMTWFKKDPDIRWLPKENIPGYLATLKI